MNNKLNLLVNPYDEFKGSVASSPAIIGPKLQDEEIDFFASKFKQNTSEEINLSLVEVVSNHFHPLELKVPSNCLSIGNFNETFPFSNKESIIESSFKNNNEDIAVPAISRPEAQTSQSQTQPIVKKSQTKKKLDFKKTLTAIIHKAKPIQKIEKFLNNTFIIILVNVLTIYVLFADDIRTSAFDKTSDPIFDSITLSCLAIFSLEILCTVIVKKGYFNSFFFYLDIISTFTLLFDVVWFEEITLYRSNASMNATQLARMGRASRIGTRAARIIRLVRLIRIVKLYKVAMNKAEINKFKSNKNLEEADCAKNFKKLSPSIQLSKAPDLQDNQNKPRKSRPSAFLNNPRKSSGFSAGLQQHRPSKFSEKSAFISRLSHKWYMHSPSQSQSPHKSLKSPLSVMSYAGYDSMNAHESLLTDKNESCQEMEEEMKLKESAVGKKLSEQTTKRVIVLVLIMIVCIPLFDSKFFYDPAFSFAGGLIFLSKFQDQTNGALLISLQELNAFCDSYIQSESNNKLSTLIYLKTPFLNSSCELYESLDPDSIRFDAKMTLELDLTLTGMITATIDQSQSGYYNAIINMTRTIFVTFILLFGTLFFSRDANELVLHPIERMIEKVNRIAENPLCIKELRLANEKDRTQNELVIIENSILKIGTLLALGFGEAGREIIASNVNEQKGVDPLIRGNRKYAVYGFCDIRNFTDATEVLQEEVMVFVNNIADIVHSMVDRCLGSANKNIGDAFLLVWKLPDLSEDLLAITEEKRKVTDICDLAVFSFLKIIGKLNRHPRILQYRTHPKLVSRFKDYKVKLGFGMHYGWSIEGAIGSSYKIDASYLSPNVNLASRLEAATKQYGVPFLFSSELYRCLSEDIQQFSRKIDIVTLKGSLTPLGLYTFDVLTDNLPPSKPEAQKQVVQNKKKIQKDAMLNFYNVKNYITKDLFCYDKDIRLILRGYESELPARTVFEDGLKGYISGDWTKARKNFETYITLKGGLDSPSNVLLDFMKKHNWKCPEDWPGYRELIEK